MSADIRMYDQGGGEAGCHAFWYVLHEPHNSTTGRKLNTKIAR